MSKLLKLFIKYKKYCELLSLTPSEQGFHTWCQNVYDCDTCYDRYQNSKAVINHG